MKIAAVIAVCVCLLCGGVAFADEPIELPATIESTFHVSDFAAVQSDLEQLLFSEENRAVVDTPGTQHRGPPPSSLYCGSGLAWL